MSALRLLFNTKNLHLDLDFTLSPLLLLALEGLGLGAHDTTTPVSAGLLILVQETLLDGLSDLGKFALVLAADLSDSESSRGLSYVSVDT